MFRFLAILLAVYVVYKLIKMLFIGMFTSRKPPSDSFQSPPEPPKNKKIITKDEGEYVDYEEVDDDK